MDRRVKERLIGASILVALIVLVVPELLSGPKPVATPPGLPAIAPEPIRNVTVDLAEPHTNAPPAAVASVPSEAAAAVAPANTTMPSPSKPTPSNPAPVKPTPVETVAPSPTSKLGPSWSVQLGSFASRENADNLSRQVKGLGFAVYVLPGGSGSAARYRVRVGPLADRESAERTAAKLKSMGHASSLVAPAA
jgi:DedD protein